MPTNHRKTKQQKRKMSKRCERLLSKRGWLKGLVNIFLTRKRKDAKCPP